MVAGGMKLVKYLLFFFNFIFFVSIDYFNKVLKYLETLLTKQYNMEPAPLKLQASVGWRVSTPAFLQ